MAYFTAIHDIPNLGAPGETFALDDENAAERLLGMNAIREATNDEAKLLSAESGKPAAKKAPSKKAPAEPKAAKTETQGAAGGDTDDLEDDL